MGLEKNEIMNHGSQKVNYFKKYLGTVNLMRGVTQGGLAPSKLNREFTLAPILMVIPCAQPHRSCDAAHILYCSGFLLCTIEQMVLLQ